LLNTNSEKLNNEINILRKRLNEHETMLENLNKFELQLQNIRHIENEIINKKKELEDYNIIIENNTRELNEIESHNINDLEKNVINLRKQLEKIKEYEMNLKIKTDKERRIIELKSKNDKFNINLIELNKQYLILKQEIENSKDIVKISEEHENKLEQLKEGLKKIELFITEKKVKQLSISEELNRINNEIIIKEKKRKTIHTKTQYIDWLDKSFVNIISIIEKNILVSLYNEFNLLFQEWFDILIENEMISAKLNDEFTPIVQQNGYDTELENLSGGEKTALALAYRLALNKVINDITSTINTKDIIMLDEPTDGFSEQQLDKIRDVLERLNMKQVIIVSHESKIESFVDNIIKIEKNEHISTIC
jgi:DNA repair protein SbcC/Rad50